MSGSLRAGAYAFGLAALMCAGGPAFAQQADASGWRLDTRLRYEAVSQSGLEDADALTLRARLRYETPSWRGLAALIEAEGVADLAGDYNDTVNGRTGFATIADPEALELNRLQLSWAGAEGQRLTLGRQRIVLGNARFVGNVGFRQNEQTFDALRFDAPVADNVNLTYLYIDRVRRVFGDDSPQGEWDSDSHVIAAEAQTAWGRLGAYALLLDFPNARAQSSQTYGVRWSREWTGGAVIPRLTLEAARQSEYRGDTASFEADYHLAEFAARRGPAMATLGWEQLAGDGSRGFSTPLATLHVFQGWADVFLATPPDGVRDLYAGLAYRTLPWPYDQPVTLTLVAHSFSDDNGAARFGEELDASARFVLSPRAALELKAAHFDGEDPRFPDRDKMWLSLDLSF
jgi:hypothetical protein